MIWRYLLAIGLSLLVLFIFQSRHRDAVVEDAGRAPDRKVAVEGEPAETIDATPASGPVEFAWGPSGIETATVPAGAGDAASTVLLRATDAAPLSLAVRVGGGAAEGGWDWRTIDDFEVEEAEGRRIHRSDLGDGLRVELTIREPEPGSTRRHLLADVAFVNTSDEPREVEYLLYGASGLRTESDEAPGSDLFWAFGRREGTTVKVDAARIDSLPSGAPGRSVPSAAWVGAYNARSLAALYLRPEGDGERSVTAHAWQSPFVDGFGGATTALHVASATVAAGATRVDPYGFYVGPRDRESLEPYATLRFDDANRIDVDLGERYRMRVDTGNGSVASFFLRGYGRETSPDGELVPADYELLLEPVSGPGTFSLEVYEERLRDDLREQVPLGFATRPWTLERSDDGSSVVLRSRGAGLLVTKTIRAAQRAAEDESSDLPWHFDVSVKIENLSNDDRQVFYRLYGPSAIDTESIRAPGTDITFAVGFWSRGRVVTQTLSPGDIAETSGWNRVQGVAWIGLTNSYFATIFFPRGGPDGDKAPFIDRALATSFPDPGFIAREAAEQGADVRRLPADLARELADDAYKNVRTAFTSVLGPLAPQGSLEHTYGCFAAPRESSNFAPYEHLGFGSINDYGKLHILVAFFIRLLDFLHTIAFGSWGFAIILLTFIVKLCLHPLNRRSQRAMMRAQKKMQALKPAMDEIKERYGSDRLAMQREMQRLFREHNFNPAAQLGGCLIIFLQLPIWIGLYNTLGYAIGLRHAEFLWIDDLTQPDRLIEFGRPILFVSSLNILPILYVILTVINQRLQPRPSDPQLEAQFKMMTFMLIFFGVIFYGFPAGFMLYIMTSAALGIFESKLIKSQIAKEVPAEPAVASATAGPAYRAPRPVAAERGTQQSFRERKKRKRRR